MSKKIVILDTETGEKDFEGDAVSYTIINKKENEAAKRYYVTQKAINEGRIGQEFTFADVQTVEEVADKLTTSQCGLLLVLQTYMDYCGVLRNKALREEDKTPMTKIDIQNTLKLNRQTCSDFLNACIEHGIIEDTDNVYQINYKYFLRGRPTKKRVRNMVKVYIQETRAMAAENKPSDLGKLYRLLPFIHYGTNKLTSNPSESYNCDVKPLTQKEICERLGMDRKTFVRLIQMKYDGKPVLIKEGEGRESYYMINPWLFCRREKPSDIIRLSDLTQDANESKVEEIKEHITTSITTKLVCIPGGKAKEMQQKQREFFCISRYNTGNFSAHKKRSKPLLGAGFSVSEA